MFGDRLKQRREEKGLTQEDVAAFFGDDCTRQSVSKWERGPVAYPEVDKLLVLAVNLDMSLDEWFSEELSYLRKQTSSGDAEMSYLGLIAGLKVFITAIEQIKQESKKGE